MLFRDFLLLSHHVLRFSLTVQYYGYVYVPFIHHSNPSPSFHAHVIAIHPSRSCPSVVVSWPLKWTSAANLLLSHERALCCCIRSLHRQISFTLITFIRVVCNYIYVVKFNYICFTRIKWISRCLHAKQQYYYYSTLSLKQDFIINGVN